MKLKGKFILDYETLFVNHQVLNDFHDCLLIVPYSNFVLFNQLIKDCLQSEDYSNTERDTLKQFYKPFVDTVFSNKKVFEEIVNKRKELSSPICISTMNSLFLCFSNSFVNPKLKIHKDAFKQLDKFTYDVLAISQKIDAPIFTTNKDLLAFVKNNNTNVQYIEPNI